ncbi:putative hydrocarbon binding protein (contains V4R domain) [Archaeoglobus sulfaticallidus PM70-1]|uniref:Putative hydrocarbon binding protein (Contains V4R domain) n=1 Tax=Archaeoglobus sulfaticallidus PM70-1 TaxID=387631 RepID=N0BIJ5_9EURY|nr:V4R domain-containing protein [Archaeoglobus sulfaticallidus]AGK60291.1 putative hydrocarbon binding protein (contains V4R domain) [Archaeoglobus sulfaticallidus PM70-1]
MLRELDETRLKILEILDKPKTTTEIAKTLGLSKSTISHHLKILSELKLVKVVKTEIERNFIKKYYISTLNTPNQLLPQEVFKGFRLSNREFLRALLRSFTLLNLENKIFLRKIGLDIGYFLLADKVEGETYEGIADLWEKLRLGKVVEITPNSFVVEDCYMCRDLPNINDTYCKTDEGIIEGILLGKTGKRYLVKEVKCWGTGDEVCEFEIKNTV